MYLKIRSPIRHHVLSLLIVTSSIVSACSSSKTEPGTEGTTTGGTTTGSDDGFEEVNEEIGFEGVIEEIIVRNTSADPSAIIHSIFISKSSSRSHGPDRLGGGELKPGEQLVFVPDSCNISYDFEAFTLDESTPIAEQYGTYHACGDGNQLYWDVSFSANTVDPSTDQLLTGLWQYRNGADGIWSSDYVGYDYIDINREDSTLTPLEERPLPSNYTGPASPSGTCLSGFDLREPSGILTPWICDFVSVSGNEFRTCFDAVYNFTTQNNNAELSWSWDSRTPAEFGFAGIVDVGPATFDRRVPGQTSPPGCFPD